MRRRSQRGATTVEFALVGIPVIFILISIFEMARGMWLYETVAHAVREGARYAAVHGQDCVTTPNACDAKISDIAGVIQNAGVGLDRSQLQVTVSIAGGSTSFVSDGPSSLNTLLSDSSDFSGWLFGTSPNQTVITGAGNDVVVFASYPFRSALALLWPGARPVNFATVNLAAVSRERIMF